jgi:hypothetical protein
MSSGRVDASHNVYFACARSTVRFTPDKAHRFAYQHALATMHESYGHGCKRDERQCLKLQEMMQQLAFATTAACRTTLATQLASCTGTASCVGSCCSGTACPAVT